MPNNIFLTVNFKTSKHVAEWIQSIRNLDSLAKIIVVDNFSSLSERSDIKSLSISLDFVLIENSNTGYGSALNKGVEWICKNVLYKYVLYMGNMDVVFNRLVENQSEGLIAYMPIALEGCRNRNPFLTKMQSRFFVFHYLNLRLKSSILYFLISQLITKLVLIYPSRAWTVHGSLFCLNSQCLEFGHIFNDQSFLYLEELEYGSFLDSNNIKLIPSVCSYEHTRNIATKGIYTRKEYINNWVISYKNWRKRWY